MSGQLTGLKGEGVTTHKTSHAVLIFLLNFFLLDSADIHDVKPSMLMLQPSPSFSWIESMLGFVSGFDNMDVNIYNYSGVSIHSFFSQISYLNV